MRFLRAVLDLWDACHPQMLKRRSIMGILRPTLSSHVHHKYLTIVRFDPAKRRPKRFFVFP